MAHPLSTIMFAIGHRASVCSFKTSSSSGSRNIAGVAVDESSPSMSCTKETLMVPVMRCNREGALGAWRMGSSRAPFSSRNASMLSNSSSISVLRGSLRRGRPEVGSLTGGGSLFLGRSTRSWRPTKDAVAWVHPIQAPSSVSTGWGAVSPPPIDFGMSVEMEWPVPVVASTLVPPATPKPSSW